MYLGLLRKQQTFFNAQTSDFLKIGKLSKWEIGKFV